MKQKINLRAERNFSENINVTFNFLRDNFKAIVTLMVRIAGPWLLLAIILWTPSQIIQVQNMQSGLTTAGALSVGLNLFGFIIFIIASLLGIAVVYEYFRFYLETEEPSMIDIKEVIIEARGKFWYYLGASILVGIIAGFGFVFLMIPGIYLIISLSLVFPVIAIENQTVFDAISRSFKLIRGNWWKTFGFLFVIFILVMIIYTLANSPSFFFGAFMVLDFESIGTAQLIAVTIISTISYIISFFIYTIYYIATTVVYFSLVEQHEQTGLKEQIEKMAEGDNAGN